MYPYPFPHGVPDLGIPIEDRCWRCDKRRIDKDSTVGLCRECRVELRKAAVA